MMYQGGGIPPESARLEDYLQAIRLRKWLVLALTLLGAIGAFLFSTSRQPTYTATTTVLVRPSPAEARIQGQPDPVNLEREEEILYSNEIETNVLATLGLNAEPGVLRENLDVIFQPDSDVFTIEYTSTSASDSAVVASAYADVYQQGREGAATDFLQAVAESADDDVEALKAALAEEQIQLSDLSLRRSEAAQIGRSTADIDADIAVRSTNASNLTAQLRQSEATVREVQREMASRRPAAQVLTAAQAPRDANGFGLPLTVLIGGFLGAMAGVVLAFLLERLDTTARDEQDVSSALGTSVIGAIPTLGIGGRVGTGSLVMLSASGSVRFTEAREAFRRLRSSVQFLNSSSGVSSIIITSSTPAEGKSLTAANLAIALAQNGSRVVLVSADLRRPTLERMFAMEANRPGLSDYLAHAAELNAEKVPGIDNLWLIRAGTPPDNPGELLNSDRFEQMLKELEREQVEYIVIDTPPVLSTADAVSAARFVDGVLVVIDTERTDTADLLQVRSDLERSGSKVLGAVMNRQTSSRSGAFRRDRYTG